VVFPLEDITPLSRICGGLKKKKKRVCWECPLQFKEAESQAVRQKP
jgi:hypothetical protein